MPDPCHPPIGARLSALEPRRSVAIGTGDDDGINNLTNPDGTYGSDATVVGFGAFATNQATAIGRGSTATTDGTALGMLSEANSQFGTAIGRSALVDSGATNAIALGAGSVANQANTLSVGSSTSQRRIATSQRAR